MGPQPASTSSYQSRSATCHPLQDASLKANWSPFLLHPLNITRTLQEPPLPGPSWFPFLSTWALQCQALPSSSSTAASPGFPLNFQEQLHSEWAFFSPILSGRSMLRLKQVYRGLDYLQQQQHGASTSANALSHPETTISTALPYFHLRGSLKAGAADNHTFCQPGFFRAFEGCGSTADAHKRAS